MKKVKIPKLKPEEKEEIIKGYFKKIESKKRSIKVLNSFINSLVMAFLAMCNIIIAGLFFVVTIKTRSSFLEILTISAICTSVMVSHSFITVLNKKIKKRD